MSGGTDEAAGLPSPTLCRFKFVSLGKLPGKTSPIGLPLPSGLGSPILGMTCGSARIRAAHLPGAVMADRKKNGHAPHTNGSSALQVPDVHPATFNPRGKPNGNGAKHGKAKGAVIPDSAPKQSVQYNCAKCPGYCCSYPIISLTKYDVERLGKHFGISAEEAENASPRPRTDTSASCAARRTSISG